MDAKSKAYITGFDGSTVLNDTEDPHTYDPIDDINAHLPWAAPELVVIDNGAIPIVDLANDIFSFARVMLQVQPSICNEFAAPDDAHLDSYQQSSVPYRCGRDGVIPKRPRRGVHIPKPHRRHRS